MRLSLGLRHRAVLLLIATACGGGDEGPRLGAASPVVLEESVPLTTTRVDTLVRGLEVPWGVAELADGSLFIAERLGRIRYWPVGASQADVWATLDVYAVDPGIGPEAGLMGIAVDPDTASGPTLYALATTWRSTGDREARATTRLWRRVAAMLSPSAGLRYKNQVLRITRDRSGRVRREVIVDDLPTAYYHAGGSLAIGPDGHLYVGVGDAMLPEAARAPDILLGKLLRYTRNGDIPRDNPDPTSPVYARGLRNTQAIAWLSDGTLVGVDHGPSGMAQEGGRSGADELNVLRPGGDYGWPTATGWESTDGIIAPIWVWERPIAPGGVAAASRSTADTTHLVVGGLRGHLERLTLARTDGAWRVRARSSLETGRFGRVRTVLSSRDGTLLVTTSNRDARGIPRPGDDMVLRLTLAP